MPSELTKITDLIIPEILSPYLIEDTIHKSAFINSGIATSDPSVNLSEGGTTVSIPFFKRTGAIGQVLVEGQDIETKKIVASKSIGAVHALGMGFAVSDLSKHFSGSDPIGALSLELSDDWAQTYQQVAIASLEGVFGVTEMADSVLDASSQVLTADMMADAGFLIGDNYSKISCVAMHSAVLATLKKLELVDWVQPSAMEPGYNTYMEKRVIVDDDIAPTEGVYPIYFFGEGSLAYNENEKNISVEYVRNAAKKQDEIYSSRIFTMHPRGMQWVGSPAGVSPTLNELKVSSNWKLAAERKNVAISMLKAKLTA